MSTRVVYKVSGESLSARSHSSSDAISIEKFRFVASELQSLVDAGHEVVAVVGGGNICRGSDLSIWPMSPLEADELGIIATAMNAKFLASVLREIGLRARVLARGVVRHLGELSSANSANEWLQSGGVVVVAGGVGIAFVSSDYAAVHHAVELNARRVLAAKTGTDGVYDKDPNRNPGARKFDEISCSAIMRTGIEVLDFSAIELARRFGVQIDVFSASSPKAGLRAMGGSFDGTVIRPE